MNDQSSMLDMYGSEEDNTPNTLIKKPSISIRRKGNVNEIVIEDETLLVSDPSLTEKLLKLIGDLQRKVSILEQNYRYHSSQMFQMQQILQKMQQELDRKISYE